MVSTIDDRLMAHMVDPQKIDMRLPAETVWLTQSHIAELFQVKPRSITMHLKNIYAEGELSEEATCKEFLQVQTRAPASGRPSMAMDIAVLSSSPAQTTYTLWA